MTTRAVGVMTSYFFISILFFAYDNSASAFSTRSSITNGLPGSQRRRRDTRTLRSTTEEQADSILQQENPLSTSEPPIIVEEEEEEFELITVPDWNPEDEEIIVGDNCWLVVDDDQEVIEECEEDTDASSTTNTTSEATTTAAETTTTTNDNNSDSIFKRPIFLPYDEDASQLELIMDKVLRLTPFGLPILAYNLYDPTATVFASTIELLSSNNWVAVDGGLYQATIIAPAINGVVVASISLLFAILIGQTVSKLWQRQIDIQQCITIEASRLIQLSSLLADFPSSSSSNTRYRCKLYLQQYTSRLVSECHETVNLDLDDISRMDSELFGVMQELNQVAAAAAATEVKDDEYIKQYPTGLLLDQTMSAVEALSQQRSKRISALQATFPPLHYAILATLALSICVAFLMETDQDILVFLNAIQLRLLWTMLVATFCALGLVCYDLGHPFRGAYQLSSCVKELYDVRLQYIASLETEGEASSSSS